MLFCFFVYVDNFLYTIFTSLYVSPLPLSIDFSQKLRFHKFCPIIDPVFGEIARPKMSFLEHTVKFSKHSLYIRPVMCTKTPLFVMAMDIS